MAIAAQDRPEGTKARSAVIDIGSNSVRLVLYGEPMRAPLPLFNQKHICQLGRDLARTGRLWPRGRRQALAAANQFARILADAAPSVVHVIATAALREAVDGPEFAAKMEAALGYPVTVIDGEREATLAACGILSGQPRFTGLVGDLGGGSLELVQVEEGRIGNRVTLPLGPLRLYNVDDLAYAEKLKQYIDAQLASVDWLAEMKGQRFVAIGGAWRVLALYHIRSSGYPLEIIDGLSIQRSRAYEIGADIADMTPKQIKRLNITTSRRVGNIPHAAQVLARIATVLEPKRVMFSAAGLREGVLYDALPGGMQAQDPVLSIMRGIAEDAGLSTCIPVLTEWLAPIFGDNPAMPLRQLEAVISLSTLCRREHPSYRAQHGYARVLRMPVWGLTHADRVQLALAIFHRYGGDSRRSRTPLIHELLTSAQRRNAEILGNLLALAYELTGGMPSLIGQTKLVVTDKKLELHVPKTWIKGLPREIEIQLESAAHLLERKPRIIKATEKRAR